jgi:mycolipenoyl-CoA---2-(long-chain-fatty acyl)-trehalose mycolipenoyltransferase / long-chain-acyl-CoA---trehalose acyltransferase
VVAMKPIQEWIGEPGVVISWHPSRASLAKVLQAPVSDVPTSYQQEQHLLAYRKHISEGTDMARLIIPGWDVPGQCDVRAMTHVINAYLRRHDTFHSWFEFTGEPGAGEIIRHTVTNPRDIKFVATEHGEMAAAEWRDHVMSTPDPYQWDCFHFGVIQRADHFTIYISVDHVHTDAMFIGLAFVEIHMMYDALVRGEAPLQLPEAGSYAEYCVAQRQYTAELTTQSDEVRGWIDFLELNGGTLPGFSLPLGDASVPHSGDVITLQLLDLEQTDKFEAACTAAGARFSGGVFACGALAHTALTGENTYSVITPTTTRRTQVDFMTTGWFTGLVPIAVPVDVTSFGDTALAAQASFDGGMDLAHVPFERVLELALDEGVEGVRAPDPGVPMLSFIDVGMLLPGVIEHFQSLGGRIYSDPRSAYQVGMWVNRGEKETTVTVAFPNNSIARESVLRYVESMREVYLRVIDGLVPVEAFTAAEAADLDLKTA